MSHQLCIIALLAAQHTTTTATSPLLDSQDIPGPLAERVTPVASNEHTTNHIDDPKHERKNAGPRFLDGQHDRLNVILEEDARYVVLVDLLALLRHGVLVREHRAAAVGVGCRDDGDVVLELVEVGLGGVDGVIEGVDERWVKGAVRQLRDDVRKVESCTRLVLHILGRSLGHDVLA